MNANILIKIIELISKLFTNTVYYSMTRKASLIIHYRQREMSTSPNILLTHVYSAHKNIYWAFTNQTLRDRKL